MAKSFKELRERMSPERQTKVAAKTQTILLQMALQELRQSLGITQAEVAQVLDINQAAISKMERQEDIRISSLIRFVEALGGKLKLVASFPDQDVVINQFEPTDKL